MMGWDLILEYIIGLEFVYKFLIGLKFYLLLNNIGTASTSNALSQYIDYLCDRKIRNFLQKNLPMNLTGLGPYPDFLAFGLACGVTCLMIIGVKESALMNKLFTIFNIIILTFIIVSGATRANFANWSLQLNVKIFYF